MSSGELEKLFGYYPTDVFAEIDERISKEFQ
jgi:hypothetical protein